ncbi:MAG: hypothetical protein COA94_02080 [Rickettsiales bacterium]|nr:MAG: hypothetical protein COA94_02080 [Rickettsiales bacterium]
MLSKSKEIVKLPWTRSSVYRLKTIGDGSCFFHALSLSYYLPYISNISNGTKFNRRQFVKDLRLDLSNRLASKVDKFDKNSKTFYEYLSRGKLHEMSLVLDKYKLYNMQEELKSNSPVDNTYNEFISEILDKDIYLIDIAKMDVYITGNDMDLLYKGRDSIVIGIIGNHYELIGTMNNLGIMSTLFSSENKFISDIKNRMKIILGV